jgi:hypothetical protein
MNWSMLYLALSQAWLITSFCLGLNLSGFCAFAIAVVWALSPMFGKDDSQ